MFIFFSISIYTYQALVPAPDTAKFFPYLVYLLILGFLIIIGTFTAYKYSPGFISAYKKKSANQISPIKGFYCSYCGFKMNQENNFCPNCGKNAFEDY